MTWEAFCWLGGWGRGGRVWGVVEVDVDEEEEEEEEEDVERGSTAG